MTGRRDVIAMIGGALAAFPRAGRAQEAAPRVAFNPAIGVAQAFRVGYGLRDRPAASAAMDRFVVGYRLTVTPLARNDDGWRLRLLVDTVERPQGAAGMNMVVAAALILDGLPFEMQVDARGFLKHAADWPALQRTLRQRADARLGDSVGIGYSVVDHNAEQVAWHLARALDAAGFARAYLDRAERFGAATVSWFGTPVDIAVERPDGEGEGGGEGSVAIAWARRPRPEAGPGAPPDDEGRAVFRRDGVVARLTRRASPPGYSSTSAREIIAMEAVAAP